MMAYFNRLFIFGLASSALSLTACDKASIGEYGTGTDSDSGSGSGSGSDSDSDSTGASVTSTSSTSGASGSASATTSATSTATTGDTDTDTGGGLCPQSDEFTCTEGADCSLETCGGLEPFDEQGCLRPSCSDHGDCAADERCYRGELFGDCLSGWYSCSDDASGSCVCASSDDCGGRMCVPAEDYPLAHATLEMGPAGESRYQDGCAPNDAPAFDFLVGLSDASCGGSSDHALEFQLLPPLEYGVYGFGDGITLGRYDLDGSGTFDAGEELDNGFVVIEGIEGETLSGVYEFLVGDTLIYGTFAQTGYCEAPILCG